MRKFLFIGFYFNHTNEIASKRLRAIGKYLPGFGWEPIVIVPKIDSLNPDNSEFSNIQIIETPYEYMLDKFVKKESNKTSTKDDVDFNKTNSKKQNKIIEKGIQLAGEVFAYPDGMKYWYEPTIEVCRKIIEKENIECIFSSSFPITSHIIGCDLKKEFNIPWIAELRDLWNLNPYINHTSIRTYFEKRLEKKTFSNVDGLITTTLEAKKTLETLHPNKNIYSIPSGYDSKDYIDFLDKKETPNDKLNFTYAGTLYQGKRDPSLIFQSINELICEGKIDESKISLNFYGSNDNLEELSKKFNVENVVNIHGFIPHRDVLKKEFKSNILMLISWNNKKEKIFLPGKVFEYMALKKPVLSIGYKEGALKNFINQTNIGYHSSTLSETKNNILKFYNEFIETGENTFCGNSEIENYSINKTMEKFAKVFNEASKL